MKLKKLVTFSFVIFLMFVGIGLNSSVFAETIVPQGTITILSDQFSGRRDLVNIVIPKSVERICPGAFYNCTSLKSVKFEEGSVLKYIDDSVFQNCKVLENINLPDSVLRINAHAFWDCAKLPTTLTLPASLQVIETTAFFNLKLNSVILPTECKYQAVDHGFPFAPSFPESCVITGGIACDFYNHLALPLPEIVIPKETSPITLVPDEKFVVPQGTTEIGSNEFSQRADLVHVIIPKSVKKIGSSAFYGCQNLKTVSFEEGSQVKCIDYFTFQNCMSLERISFPKTLLQIRAHSFWGCIKLVEVLFNPESIVYIDANSFFITKLEKVALPSACRYQALEHGFPNAASFPENCIILGGIPHDFYHDRPRPFPLSEIKATTFKTSERDNFIVPQGTTKIESTQFIGRADIVDIIIPKSVQVICPGAFYLCTNLKSITFEEGSMLKSIESYAFQNCHSIEKIIIPEGTIQVRTHAFWACPNLKFVHIPASMRAIDCSAFYTTKIAKVILPSGCKYQGGIRKGFPYEKSFPENCVVEGGTPCDWYEGVIKPIK